MDLDARSKGCQKVVIKQEKRAKQRGCDDLKIYREQSHGGSSPFPGTIQNRQQIRQKGLIFATFLRFSDIQQNELQE